MDSNLLSSGNPCIGNTLRRTGSSEFLIQRKRRLKPKPNPNISKEKAHAVAP